MYGGREGQSEDIANSAFRNLSDIVTKGFSKHFSDMFASR